MFVSRAHKHHVIKVGTMIRFLVKRLGFPFFSYTYFVTFKWKIVHGVLVQLIKVWNTKLRSYGLPAVAINIC